MNPFARKQVSTNATRSPSRYAPGLKLLLAAGILLESISLAHAAGPLKDVLGELLKSSPRLTAARSDQAGAEARVTETHRRAWTPTIDLTTEVGKQRFETNTTSNPDTLSTDRTVLRVTQLVYDFGRSNRQVGEAQAVASQSTATSAAAQDGVLLEALTAHWSVVRSQRVVEYSRQSEASVRNQANLENSQVELGKGYESNVLQAKVQLASAEARRVRAEGALGIAQSRIVAVFGPLAGRVPYAQVAMPALAKLPKTLAEAKATAEENNKQLKIGVYRSQAIGERLSVTQAREFMPKIQLIAENGVRHNIDVAQAGARVNDKKILLQLSYSFNAGMAGSSAMDAVKKELEASTSREIETRDLVMEQVSIAWHNLAVAKINKETLGNQVRIAAQFLQMASAERQLGRRTLLDVLTAEVSLINAMSDMVSTGADEAIAGLTLLQAIGKLDVDALDATPVETAMPKIGSAAAAKPGA